MHPYLSDIFPLYAQLHHAILQVLDGTQHAWVARMLFAFNAGDIKTFSQLHAENAASNVPPPHIRVCGVHFASMVLCMCPTSPLCEFLQRIRNRAS
jgi:hypothetical protein